MANVHRRTASARPTRTNRDHGELVKLAAMICGRSLSMVYKVRNGKAKSAIVQRAIQEAERRIRNQERAA